MPKTESDSRLIPIGKASSYLGISRDTLRRWEKRGIIAVVRSPTNRRYYTKQQLDEVKQGKKPQKTPVENKKSPQKAKSQKSFLIPALFFLASLLITLIIISLIITLVFPSINLLPF